MQTFTVGMETENTFQATLDHHLPYGIVCQTYKIALSATHILREYSKDNSGTYTNHAAGQFYPSDFVKPVAHDAAFQYTILENLKHERLITATFAFSCDDTTIPPIYKFQMVSLIPKLQHLGVC
jgi:hypothetical protein